MTAVVLETAPYLANIAAAVMVLMMVMTGKV